MTPVFGVNGYILVYLSPAWRSVWRKPARTWLENGLIGTLLGHVGDGNFHVALLVDTNSSDEIRWTEAFVSRVSQRAIVMEGTCTGEHGIGQGKISYLRQEFGAAVVIVHNIKQTWIP